MGKDGTRAEVIAKHREWLWSQLKEGAITVEELAGLHGKDLACWCAPLACHAETLERAAAWAQDQIEGGLCHDGYSFECSCNPQLDEL
jgi:hypothetical protein